MNKGKLFYNHKNSRFFLGLILFVFCLKGLLLAAIFPIFDGQDEARHYNTIQYLAYPQTHQDNHQPFPKKKDKDDFSSYFFSEEIKNTSRAADVNILRGDIFNTIKFSKNYNGLNETEINKKQWEPQNYNDPADIVYDTQFYHKAASLLERLFSKQDVLFRFYLLRFFSVFLGTIAILFSYLTVRAIGFSTRHSLFITAIISFQPKLSTYFSSINYDVLFILFYIIFVYLSVLALKKGFDYKKLLIILAIIFFAIITKGTALIMAVIFGITYCCVTFWKMKESGKKINPLNYLAILLLFVIILLLLHKYFSFGSMSFFGIINSLIDYCQKTLTIGRFALSSRTYWGTLSWVNNPLIDQITNIIWLIQFFSVAGLGAFLFSKMQKPPYLPEKKYIYFLIGTLIALQLGIRFFDWKTYIAENTLALGTPGRYFLPNIVAHMVLVFTGLGMFFELRQTKRKNVSAQHLFDFSLKLSLVLMMSLTMYLIFNEVIYRYYL